MKEEDQEKKLKKDLISAILVLFVKLAGETLKDKMARAVVIGAVAAAGYYFDLNPVTVDIQPSAPSVTLPQPQQ